MHSRQLRPVVLTVFVLASLAFVLTTLSIVSMRFARHRAYTEMAMSCERISVVTVDNARYFCAPVARIEEGVAPEPTAATASSSGTTPL